MASILGAGSSPGQELYLTAYFVPISIVSKWPLGQPSEKRYWYIPYAIALNVIATIAICIRLYASLSGRIRKAGLDDCLITLGWLCLVGFTAITCWGIKEAGFDRHIWEAITTGEKSGIVSWVSEILFLTGTNLTKLSILVFQRRLLARTHKPIYLRAIDAAIVFTIAYYFAFLFFLIFACSPVNAAWKSMDISYAKPYKCTRRHIPDLLVGVISIISDVYALMLPEVMIYQLRIDKRTKRVLYLIFGAGALTVGASIARTYWLSRLQDDPLRDLTWVAYETMVWGQMEAQLSLVCASAPSLKAFISNVKSGSTQRSKEYGTALTPISRNNRTTTNTGHSFTGTAYDEEVAEGKGILVTETVSLNSALASSELNKQMSPRSPPSHDMARSYSRPTYSSNTSNEKEYVRNSPEMVNQFVPHSALNQASYNTQQAPNQRTYHHFSHPDRGRLPHNYYAQEDRAKAIRVLGGEQEHARQEYYRRPR